jgi:hypothetical protein
VVGAHDAGAHDSHAERHDSLPGSALAGTVISLDGRTVARNADQQ